MPVKLSILKVHDALPQIYTEYYPVPEIAIGRHEQSLAQQFAFATFNHRGIWFRTNHVATKNNIQPKAIVP